MTTPDQKRLVDSLKLIAHDLSEILHQLQASASRADESRNELKHSQASPIAVVTHQSEADRAEQKVNQGESDRLQRKELRVQVALCIGTWLAFGAAAYYACIARNTLVQISSQTESMGKAAQANERAANAALESNKMTEEATRGVIELKTAKLSPLSIGEAPSIVVTTENIGATMAFVTATRSGVKRWASQPNTPEYRASKVDSMVQLGRGQSSSTVLIDSEPASQDFISEVANGRMSVYFFMNQTYTTLGKTHQFCVCVLLAKLDERSQSYARKSGDASVVSALPYTLIQCPKWNNCE